MSLGNTLLNILKGAAEAAEEQAIVVELQQIHDADQTEWATVCDGASIFAAKIQAKSNSAFVKAIMQGIIDAVETSRENNPGPAQTGDTNAGGQ